MKGVLWSAWCFEMINTRDIFHETVVILLRVKRVNKVRNIIYCLLVAVFVSCWMLTL